MAPRASCRMLLSRASDRLPKGRWRSVKARRLRSCRAASSSSRAMPRRKYDNPPEAYGAFSFAAMDLILDSIEKVGPDRKKVIEELANVKERDSIVGKVTFDDHGQNTVAVITKYVVQDGKFAEWDDSEYATGKRKLPGQR